MNDYGLTGFYTGNNLKNAPSTGYVVWITLANNNDAAYSHQICFSASGQYRMYIRFCNNEVWSGWRSIDP